MQNNELNELLEELKKSNNILEEQLLEYKKAINSLKNEIDNLEEKNIDFA